jgi:plasmid stabilization system protein ParE
VARSFPLRSSSNGFAASPELAVLAVAITPRALGQIERAALWWAENRPAARDAIRLDLAEALEVLAQQPGIGARCSARHYSDVRRLYLARTSYHLYYRLTGENLIVLAFWHASRGRGPTL